MSYQITIDGPAGAGKTSMSKAIATKLSILCIDTGAFYRAFAIGAIENGLSSTPTEKEISDFITSDNYQKIQIKAITDNYQQVMIVGDTLRVFDEALRTNKISQLSSILSSYELTRNIVNNAIREYASTQSCIMEGRDTGTVILPDADIKFYLTATSFIRATRRALDNYTKGINCDLNFLQKEIETRDERDMSRPIAPLKQAPDAIYIDNSDMTEWKCFELMLHIIETKLNNKEK